MATINELMAGKQPGEIKLTRSYWSRQLYFQPYYKNKQGCWFGPDEHGNHSGIVNADLDDWLVYEEEPKKKVKRWLWATRKCEGKSISWHIDDEYMTEELVRDCFKPSVYIKLPWSEMEFDE